MTTSHHTLRIGTRRSPLALWQAHWVRDRLLGLHADIQIEVVHIQTKGDKSLDAPLAKIGDKGLFTREIERALLDERIDLAVHSLKDLPTVLPESLTLGAVCEREDPSDVLVVRRGAEWASLSDLPRGASVATGSLRRQAQLLHLRPDLRIVNIRGNVGTRLRKLDESDWAATVMARAGLSRMGLRDRVSCVFPAREILSAVAQGALGIEIRDDDEATAARVAPLNHAPTEAATTAERAFLRRLEGGCQVPVAALAHARGEILTLEGLVASLDGTRCFRGRMEQPLADAADTGEALANRLLEEGAGDILEEIRTEGSEYRIPNKESGAS